MSVAAHVGWTVPHYIPPPDPLPVLLMHFDGDLVDATGNTTFSGGGQGTAFDFVTGSPGFGQAVLSSGNSSIAGASSIQLGLAGQPFTFEGRCVFGEGDSVGVVLAKNYFSTEPAPEVFNIDFALFAGPGHFRLEWSGGGVGKQVEADYTAIYDSEFSWAITDDLTLCRTYVNGVLVDASPSVSLAATPPRNSGAAVTVLNALRGFAGPSPDWGGSGFRGRLDELRYTLGHALYTGDSYAPASRPFTYRP